MYKQIFGKFETLLQFMTIVENALLKLVVKIILNLVLVLLQVLLFSFVIIFRFREM